VSQVLNGEKLRPVIKKRNWIRSHIVSHVLLGTKKAEIGNRETHSVNVFEPSDMNI